MPNFDVVEFSHGTLHIGDFKRLPSVLDLDSFKNPDRVLFSSAYLHCDEMLAWWEENKMLPKEKKKPYTGPVRSEFIYFDFDSKDLFYAMSDAQQLVRDLIEKHRVNPACIRVFFSGGKGFHVYLLDSYAYDMEPGPYVPAKVRAAVLAIAGHLPTLDTGIYQPVQIFRVPNSKHNKTGLFKIPLTVEEFLKYDPFEFADIQALAKEPREIKWEMNINSSGFIDRLLESAPLTLKRDSGSYSDKIRRGLQDGGRNTTIASLAGMLFKSKVEPETAAFVIGMYNSLATPPLPDSEVEKIISSIKRYHPSTAIEEAVKAAGLLTPEECRKIYLDACKDDEEGIKFGYQILDSVFGGLNKNEIFTIVASPGCVKTTSLQNMGIRALKSIKPHEFVAFFSMDMQADQEYERRAQITTGLTSRREMRRLAKSGDLVFEAKLRAADMENSRFLTCYHHGLSVAAMRDIILREQEKRGEVCRFVMIDYFDKIKMPVAFSPPLAAMQEIRDLLAKDLGTSVLLLVQTNKDIACKNKWDLDTRDGKGGTAIDQEPNFLIRLAWCENFDGSLTPCGMFKKHRRFERDTGTFPFFKLIYEGKNYTIKDMVEIDKDDPLITGAKIAKQGGATW